MKRTYFSPVIEVCRVSAAQLMLTASGMPTLDNTEDADDSQVFGRSFSDMLDEIN